MIDTAVACSFGRLCPKMRSAAKERAKKKESNGRDSQRGVGECAMYKGSWAADSAVSCQKIRREWRGEDARTARQARRKTQKQKEVV